MTNLLMTAIQKRRLISSTSHIIQEYGASSLSKHWASFLFKVNIVDSNSYWEIHSLLDTIPKELSAHFCMLLEAYGTYAYAFTSISNSFSEHDLTTLS